ncbi:hypothetical protein KO465_00655 [Candidatus Micrarchaeota archaeon]|nr:hypothetical protein [Candidatus Micrarchaeota archaeon]
MVETRELLDGIVSGIMLEKVLAVCLIRDDGIPYIFKSKDVLITQQSVQPIASINNISKYIHSELTNDSKATSEKTYVFIKGDKHDYIFYPVDASHTLVLFIDSMNDDEMDSFIERVKISCKEILNVLE